MSLRMERSQRGSAYRKGIDVRWAARLLRDYEFVGFAVRTSERFWKGTQNTSHSSKDEAHQKFVRATDELLRSSSLAQCGGGKSDERTGGWEFH